MLRLIWKNAWRSKRRTVLTVLSIAASLFLLSTMLCYISSQDLILEHAGGSLRLVSRHASGLTFNLPEAYLEKVRRIPHVTMVQGCVWFGGQVEGKEHLFISNIACDLENMEEMWDEYAFEPGVRDKLKAELRGAAISKGLLARMRAEEGWEIGRTVTLRSPIYQIPLEFVLLGTIDGPDQSLLMFRRDYLEKARGNPGEIGYFWIRVDQPANLPVVAAEVDRHFANSDYETKTETEKAFMESFNSMMGNITTLVMNIGLAVVVTILLVAANTMAMTARERTTEHAVMRCLGFGRARIAVLFVSESVLISLFGAAVGVGAALAVFREGKYDLGGFAPMFHMTAWTTGVGFAVAVGVGFAAGLLPAIGAARRSIVDGLRRLD